MANKVYRITLRVVGTDVPEFKEGLGKGVLGTCEAVIDTDTYVEDYAVYAATVKAANKFRDEVIRVDIEEITYE